VRGSAGGPQGPTALPDKLHFAVSPHPDAPELSTRDDAAVVVEQIIGEWAGANAQLTERVRQLTRELALTSLWFCEKFVGGHSGPYNELNTSMHLEMANWRQSEACMRDGARAAALVPRGFLKSTILNHGACAWELLRNPSLRIRITNAVIGRAVGFKRNVMHFYDQNEMVEWLFPTYYVHHPKAQANWSDLVMVLPNRPRWFTEPNLKAGGMTGSAEGDHHDLHIVDDPQGVDDLDTEHNISLDVQSRVNWFKTNKTTLMVKPSISRLVFIATRYAADDVFGQCIGDDVYECKGYPMPDLELREEGTYSVYYRRAEEDGKMTCPEIMDRKQFEKLLKDDPWTAQFQYLNDHTASGTSEFRDLPAKEAVLFRDQESEKLYVDFDPDTPFPTDPKELDKRLVSLGDLDIVLALDPAGTDKGINAKTCRSALAMVGVDPYDRKILLWGSAGYFDVYKIFEEAALGLNRFPGYVRCFGIEKVALQSILLPIARTELRNKDVSVRVVGVPAVGDKIARIRNIVGVELMNQRFYALRGQSTILDEERIVFPNSKHRMDFLDAVQLALATLKKPRRPRQVARANYARRLREDARSPITGN